MSALAPSRSGSALRTISYAGLIAGALDITAAFIIYGFFGAKPIPLLQGIAAGWLGPRASSGGLATAALGMFFQFFIAFAWASLYYVLSRQFFSLMTRPLICGPLYGVFIYFFMNRIIVPLSAARKYPFSVRMMVIGLAIHIFCVGLPIATVVKRFSA